MPDCLHPQRFQMDGPADGKTRCALCELERVVLDHAASLHDLATSLLRAERAERDLARRTAEYNAAAKWRDTFKSDLDALNVSIDAAIKAGKRITADRDKAVRLYHDSRAEVARLTAALLAADTLAFVIEQDLPESSEALAHVKAYYRAALRQPAPATALTQEQVTETLVQVQEKWR